MRHLLDFVTVFKEFGFMDNVTNFMERSKEFEQAHYSCKELLEEPIGKIERFVSRWLLIALAANFAVMLLGFIFINKEITKIRKKVDHRYFQIEDILEDIHSVKIENGKVVRDYQPLNKER